MKDWFLIGEFSKITGLSLKALRLYEEKGLLVSRERGDNSYRYFSAKQVGEGKRIVQFKELGFSLDQIKMLLTVTAESTLYEVVKSKVAESKKEMSDLGARIHNLESLLSSLENNSQLTEQQRGVLMESIFETSLNNLKRQGVVANAEVQKSLKSEVDEFSPELQKLIPELRHILKVMKENNIYVGPGRGSSLGSLVLFSEGYSPLNPLDFDLMPELFSKSKAFWMDVEFSNSELIGRLCEEVSKKINFEVVAFKSPALDIFREMQNTIGDVNFDKFSDFDPMILEAPKRIGVRGLWGPDWNPDFEAFRTSTPEFQREANYSSEQIHEIYKDLKFQSPMDYVNTEILRDFRGRKELDLYLKGSKESIHPELEYTKGYLLYREDWLKIYMRLTGASASQAIEVTRRLREFPEKCSVDDLKEVKDEAVRQELFDAVSKIFNKGHAVGSWWYYKRTAILKSLWPEQYLNAIKKWEDKHQMIWQEFGYKKDKNVYYLKA
ncbi:MAG: MerR family transcriptional regulator [Bdellovibrio sp.]